MFCPIVARRKLHLVMTSGHSKLWRPLAAYTNFIATYDHLIKISSDNASSQGIPATAAAVLAVPVVVAAAALAVPVVVTAAAAALAVPVVAASAAAAFGCYS